MRTHPSLPHVAAAFSFAALLAASTHAAAQQRDQPAMPTSGLRAELVHDIGELEQKYVGLVDAMTGKYGWRPGEGVRSVSEVFMHIAGANLYLPMMAGVQPPQAYRVASLQEAFPKMAELEKESSAARMKEVLRTAFAHAKNAVASVSDAQLNDAADVFGQPGTKRQVLTLLVTHMHEHLGQSIAYARSNGVVPPWSAGGGN